MAETKRIFHEAFVLSVLLKGLNAVLEAVGGAVLLLIPPMKLSHWLVLLTQHELSEDPNDFLFTKLVALAHHLTTNTQLFAAIYLLSHGVMKLVVIASLLMGKLWAYPAMIVMLFLFIVYQLWRYSYTYSAWLLWLTAFDIVLIFLTLVEYRRVKQFKPFRELKR